MRIIIVDHAAIGQREVGKEMMGADDPVHRQVGHRRVDMGHQMEPAGTDP